jgi:hypothetical protein
MGVKILVKDKICRVPDWNIQPQECFFLFHMDRLAMDKIFLPLLLNYCDQFWKF